MSIQEFETDNTPLAITLLFLSTMFICIMLRRPKEPILPVTVKDSCMTQTRNTLFHRTPHGYSKLDIMV